MKYCRIITFFIFCQLALNVFSQNYNRPIPPGNMYPYEFTQYDTTDYGYYFSTPMSLLPNKSKMINPKMIVLDKNGFLTWYSTNNSIRYFNFQYNPDTNLFISYLSNNPFGYFFIDSTFQIVDTFSIFNGKYINPHEFTILPSGNVIFSVYIDSIMDLSAYTFEGVQGSSTTKVTGDLILEYDRSKNLVFSWNCFDYISPSQNYDIYGYHANGFDYTHCNSIAEDNDGNLLISFRHLNSVYKIDPTNGNVIWRLGGKSSSFTFTNDPGNSGQHDVRCYPDGTYSMYDNAVTTTNECRAVIFTLDTVAWTATRVWEYKPSPAFPAILMGSHQITSDLNHMVNFGTSRRPYPSVDFVDNVGNKITEITFPDSILSYRTYISKLPFSFPRPVISCKLITDSIILSAPTGYQSYMWSSGEASDHITVIDTGGVYQVWVKYGFGMLGSLPFYVNDTNNICIPLSVQEEEIQTLPGAYIIFDLLGRQILKPENGNIYIYRFENGHSELRYYSEEK